MPSADITPRGKHFLMHETQVRTWNPGRYWQGTNFYAYGVGKSTELAVTSYNVGVPTSPTMATGFGFKSAPQLFSERWGSREIKATFGQMTIVNHRTGEIGSFSYAHGSFRLPRYGTRLTAGGFHGTSQLLERGQANFLAGLEHPLTQHIHLLGEWFRGRHDLGFAIPGVLVHLPHHQMVVVGYKIPNNPMNGRAGLVLEYGLVF